MELYGFRLGKRLNKGGNHCTHVAACANIVVRPHDKYKLVHCVVWEGTHCSIGAVGANQIVALHSNGVWLKFAR